MISTVFKISVLRLWNTKQELLLIFIVPILFFSIFALIFSRGVGHVGKQVSISVINDDDSDVTEKLIENIGQQDQIVWRTKVGRTESDWTEDRLARILISKVGADVVVYFPPGYGAALSGDAPLTARILNEGTNPISAQVVEATLSRAIAKQAPKLLAPKPYQGPVRAGAQTAEGSKQSAATSSVQLASATSRGTVDYGTSSLIGTSSSLQPSGLRFSQALNPAASEADSSNDVDRSALFRFDNANVFASNKHNPKIAMYAAGIAVMFLLFSASGAGASLLEDKEAGTLERLLNSRLTISQLLIGKWCYIALLGFVQITVMFVWGQVVFSVDLIGHLQGFVVMAFATTCASASFALFLAVLCKSRNQLNAISLVVVLSMSALGGSMIPRYIMSESMQRMGKFTFNGWALDGFKKIFWYDLPVSAIRFEVTVLMLIALVLGFAATVFAQRWSVT